MKASTIALPLMAALLQLSGAVLKLDAAEKAALPERPIRLAIAGFANPTEAQLGGEPSALLVDLLTSQLSVSPGFELVERAQIEQALKEAALSLGQMNQPAGAIKTGKLLSADWLLFGSFLKVEGTNSVLAKIVDGQTGVIRDLICVPFEATNALPAAEGITLFVLTSRQAVPTLDQRLFLGVGTFEDLSIKSRHSDFPRGLRAMLARHYQGTRVAVVERSSVNPLLEEMRMSLGGLSVGRPPGKQAQPAFLLVDGLYQSYQDEHAGINLVLRIERMGGRTETASIKEVPGSALHSRVVAAIDRVLMETKDGGPGVRQAEVAAQLERGRQQARISSDASRVSYLGGHPARPEFREARLKNFTEGIVAFEAALLLDPQNVEAKYYLALCFKQPEIARMDQARDYFREVIAVSTNREMVKASRRAMADSYRGVDDSYALELYMALKKDAANPREESSFMNTLADLYQKLYASGKVARVERLALEDERWRSACKEAEWTAGRGQRFNTYDLIDPALYAYRPMFKSDKPGLRKHLDEFVPKLEAEFPRLAPYLVSGYMRWSGTGASPELLERYDKLLAWYETNADQVLCPACFHGDSLFQDLRGFLYTQRYDRAADLATRLDRHGRPHLLRSDRDELDVFLGYLQRERGQWREALAAFERVGDREVNITFAGPWGTNRIVSAKRAAEECRRHLETGDLASATPVTSGDPVVSLHHSIYFIPDGPRLWLASGTEFHEFSRTDGRLRPIHLSCTNDSPIGRMAIAANKVWLGTATNGLLAYDKSTGQCRHYTEKDGLLLDRITALCATPDRLWIGFGERDSMTPLGGVGYIDLRTDRFVGLMQELDSNLTVAPARGALGSALDPPTGPPRKAVTDLNAGTSNSLWVAVLGKGVQHYSVGDRKWTTPFAGCSPRCLANSERYVMVGCYEPGGTTSKMTRFGGLVIHDIQKNDWRTVGIGEGLPNNDIKSLATDGNKVWVGGRGFLASVALPTGNVEQVVKVKESRVQNIHVDQNEVWFSADYSLYRLVRH